MESKISNIPPIIRADSQPTPNMQSQIKSISTEQKLGENEENQSDSNTTKSQHNTKENPPKQHSRPIKEIRGILKGKMKQRTFVVVFADTEKEKHLQKAYSHNHKCLISKWVIEVHHINQIH
mgnify:CR=1 FL=1